jgi:hypothetical protein
MSPEKLQGIEKPKGDNRYTPIGGRNTHEDIEEFILSKPFQESVMNYNLPKADYFKTHLK